MQNRPLICILGPTASGKTALAVAVAKRLEAEIVSADSVQVYRELNIGSAKPTISEMQGVPHHMIDCLDVDTPAFSVSMYFDIAKHCVEDIQARGKPVILAGGSGLYVNALTTPLNFAVPKNEEIRRELELRYDADPAACFSALQEADPVTAARLHIRDKKRVVRALEVYHATGKPLSAYGNDFDNQRRLAPPFPSIRFGLNMDRDLLYARIDRRVDAMLEAGLLQEAKQVFERGYSASLPAMQSIGYAQLFRYFRGETVLEEAIESIKRDTRRFAKRQLTWFRRDNEMHWLDVGAYDFDVDRLANKVIELVQAEHNFEQDRKEQGI